MAKKGKCSCFKVKLKKFIISLSPGPKKIAQLLQKYSLVICSLSMLNVFNVLINPSEASMSPLSSASASSASVSSAEDTSSSINGDTGSPFTSYLNGPPSKNQRQLTPAELLADVDRVFPSNYDSLQTPSKLAHLSSCLFGHEIFFCQTFSIRIPPLGQIEFGERDKVKCCKVQVE